MAKLRQCPHAAERGADLLDWRTWRNLLDSEWAQAVQAAADGQAALNGDPVALIGVFDYVAQQAVGVGFFDMLQGLKLTDRLWLGWYDEVLPYMVGVVLLGVACALTS